MIMNVQRGLRNRLLNGQQHVFASQIVKITTVCIGRQRSFLGRGLRDVLLSLTYIRLAPCCFLALLPDHVPKEVNDLSLIVLSFTTITLFTVCHHRRYVFSVSSTVALQKLDRAYTHERQPQTTSNVLRLDTALLRTRISN